MDSGSKSKTKTHPSSKEKPVSCEKKVGGDGAQFREIFLRFQYKNHVPLNTDTLNLIKIINLGPSKINHMARFKRLREHIYK